VFLRRAELRMTQPMNLRMFFGVAWLPIGLEWGYRSLKEPKMLAHDVPVHFCCWGASRSFSRRRPDIRCTDS
jgi:hypothetical protein